MRKFLWFFVFALGCEPGQVTDNAGEVVFLQEVDEGSIDVEQDEEGFQPATRVALKAINADRARRANGFVEPTVAPTSQVLRVQADFFAAQADLRRARFRLEADKELQNSTREFRDYYIAISKKVGAASKVDVQKAKDDYSRASFSVEESTARVREMETALVLAQKSLDEVAGEKVEENLWGACNVYETLWEARCEQAKARLESSKVAIPLLQKDVDDYTSLSYRGYANKYAVRAAEFALRRGEAVIRGNEDAYALCLLNKKQFLLMQKEAGHQ